MNLMILVSFTTHRRTERYLKTLQDITRNIYEEFNSNATCSSVYCSVMQYATVLLIDIVILLHMNWSRNFTGSSVYSNLAAFEIAAEFITPKDYRARF